MDTKPFLELDMLNLEDVVVEQFRQFTKSVFKLEVVLTSALEFKYTREIKRVLTDQVKAPSRELARLLSDQIHTGRMTDNAYEKFSQFVKRAWHQLLNDLITERLKAAMAAAEAPQGAPATQADESDRRVVTTAEELEAFYIVKAILRETMDAKRVAIRDALSYCSILFDDNNRRPICRLYFNGVKKSVGFFSTERQEAKVAINSVDDLFKYGDRLKAVVTGYLAGRASVIAPETQQ